jgi:hypothetical protein
MEDFLLTIEKTFASLGVGETKTLIVPYGLGVMTCYCAGTYDVGGETGHVYWSLSSARQGKCSCTIMIAGFTKDVFSPDSLIQAVDTFFSICNGSWNYAGTETERYDRLFMQNLI